MSVLAAAGAAPTSLPAEQPRHACFAENAPGVAATRSGTTRRNSIIDQAHSVVGALSFKSKLITKERTNKVKAGALLSPGLLAHSHDSARLLVARLKGKELSMRQRAFLLLYEPQSSALAAWVGLLVWTTLLASSMCACFETVDNITAGTGVAPWLNLRVTFNAFFTVEVMVRAVCYVPISDAWRDPFQWIAFAAVVPFWVRVIGYPNSLTAEAYLDERALPDAVRLCEALSSLRLVNLCRYYEGGAILARAASRCAAADGR